MRSLQLLASGSYLEFFPFGGFSTAGLSNLLMSQQASSFPSISQQLFSLPTPWQLFSSPLTPFVHPSVTFDRCFLELLASSLGVWRFPSCVPSPRMYTCGSFPVGFLYNHLNNLERWFPWSGIVGHLLAAAFNLYSLSIQSETISRFQVNFIFLHAVTRLPEEFKFVGYAEKHSSAFNMFSKLKKAGEGIGGGFPNYSIEAMEQPKYSTLSQLFLCFLEHSPNCGS